MLANHQVTCLSSYTNLGWTAKHTHIIFDSLLKRSLTLSDAGGGAVGVGDDGAAAGAAFGAVAGAGEAGLRGK